MVADCSRAVDANIDMGKFQEELEERNVHVIDSIQASDPIILNSHATATGHGPQFQDRELEGWRGAARAR